MRKNKKRRQMSETFIVGALLTLAGGYFDSYTFIARGGVFANAQTGNIVLLGINLAEGHFDKALTYFVPIAAFILGVFVSELVRKIVSGTRIHWRQIIVLLEFAVVVATSFLPCDGDKMSTCNMIANVMISFICAMQAQSFRRIHNITCATTMCTGNLRSGTECFVVYKSNGNREELIKGFKYYAIIGIFIVGAAISTPFTKILMEKSVLLTLPLLAAAIILMIGSSDSST